MALICIRQLIFIGLLTLDCLLGGLSMAALAAALHAHDICLERCSLGLQVRFWQALLFVPRLSQILTVVMGGWGV